MVVLLSSRGFLGKQVFGAFLAAPVAFLHHVLHHRGPRPFEILGIATVGHPAIQAVLLFARQLLAGQPQALRLFPAGEVLLPRPSLLGFLPLPLNLRIYVHVCFVSFANSANYLYGLAPHTYGVSHVLATSRYILFSLVGFGWVVRAVATILTAHARVGSSTASINVLARVSSVACVSASYGRAIVCWDAGTGTGISSRRAPAGARPPHAN